MAAPAAPPPRLTGIVRFANRKLALLELTEQSPSRQIIVREPILREGDRDGSYEVTGIDERTAEVSVRQAISGEIFDLRLHLESGDELANRTFNFQSAKLPQVLE